MFPHFADGAANRQATDRKLKPVGGKAEGFAMFRRMFVAKDSSSKAVKHRRWLIEEEFQALRCI